MTRSTRRRVLVALVVFTLTLSAEGVLFYALTTDADQQAQAWTDSLSDADLQAAADAIVDYPWAYRRAIMAALSPARRSEVWRRHIQAYRDGPNIDSATVPVLDAAIALASPEFFEGQHPDLLEQVTLVAEQLILVIGRDDTEYLLYRLGPPDGTFASAEPSTHKFLNLIRQAVVVLAREDPCNCSTSFGCSGAYECSDGTGCDPVTEWPMCGWFWSEECNGTCEPIEGGD